MLRRAHTLHVLALCGHHSTAPGAACKSCTVFIEEAPACVLDDGTVKNNRGAVLGYLNDDDHQAGSVDEQFLGDLNFESALRDAMVARGPADELVATLRLDAARLVDGGGSTLACVSRDGEITGGLGERLGVVEPFDFSLQTQVALYALFLDPGLLSSEEV